MFGICSNKTESGSESAQTVENGSNGWRKAMGSLALGSAALLTPHTLCVLGVSSLAGVGLTAFCWHSSEADSSQGIELDRMAEIPSSYKEFNDGRNARAKQALLEVEPRFNLVIAAKAEESPGKEIKVVFIENESQAYVVVCKEGALCPCSKPQVYELGHKDDLAGGEKYLGQSKVLRALYAEF